jgi:hypothetical protein
MRVTYETGKATLIQFIVLVTLNIIDALQSIITTCIHNGSDCVSNLLSSVGYYIIIVIWFGIVVAIGASAQQKRSKKMAYVLIAAEGLIIVFASYNVKLDAIKTSHNGILSLLTSLADILIAIWVVSIAYRLTRAKGGRIVRKGRVRKVHRPDSEL